MDSIGVIRTRLPSLVSASRGVVGLAGSVVLLKGHEDWIVLPIMAFGVISDLADGLLARRLRAVSPLGHKLDLLGDIACFAILPAVFLVRSLGACGAPAGAALLGYAFLRLDFRSWKCRGLPLPVVGVGAVVLVYLSLC